MSHPWDHSLSSARRWGGVPEDYLPLHDWFDASKEHLANFRHRALRHHARGIFEAERVFGPTITNSAGVQVPTRLLGEQHVREDLGRIPTLADWLGTIQAEPWMFRNVCLDGARGSAPRVIENPPASPSHPPHSDGLHPTLPQE